MLSKSPKSLIISFAAVLVFVVSLTAAGAYLLLSGIQKVEKVVAENTHRADLITDMRVAARLRALSLSQMLLTDDPFERDEEYDRFNAYGTIFVVARNGLIEDELTRKETVIYGEASKTANQIGVVQAQIIEFIQDENFEAAKKLQLGQSLPLQRKSDNLYEKLQKLQRENIDVAVSTSAEEFKGTLYILLVMAFFILIAITAIAGIVIRRAINTGQATKQRQKELEKMVEERTAEIRLAKEQAEKASQIKTDFLSQMSHELRTPLNAIIGFSQILQFDREKTLTQEQLSNAAEIQTAGTHLLELINELLDLSQIESGKLELELEPVLIYQLLNETAKMLGPLADQRGIKIINLVTETNLTALVDKFRLKQVLLNLIANAIKYNCENGLVHIDANIMSGNRLKLYIKDTGRGISDENKERVFNNFERVSSHGGIEGSGIGLSVSRHLVELMGGTIGLENTVNDGCTFWIELPINE